MYYVKLRKTVAGLQGSVEGIVREAARYEDGGWWIDGMAFPETDVLEMVKVRDGTRRTLFVQKAFAKAMPAAQPADEYRTYVARKLAAVEAALLEMSDYISAEDAKVYLAEIRQDADFYIAVCRSTANGPDRITEREQRSRFETKWLRAIASIYDAEKQHLDAVASLMPVKAGKKG